MSSINSAELVKKQYENASNLNIRILIHEKYSVNKTPFGDWIFSNYDIRGGMSLLELGCGTGGMWKGRQEAVKRCSRFILSDFSEAMLEAAKRNLAGLGGIEYRVIDAQDIPFADASFDTVIANMMLYHVPDIQRALSEIARVLKPGGVFYCATYGEHGIMEHLSSLFGEYGFADHTNKNFTLQNGGEILGKVFGSVKRTDREDALLVTDADDMADYIYSLTDMTALGKMPREQVKRVLLENMKDGALQVPKEYGMFTCRK